MVCLLKSWKSFVILVLLSTVGPRSDAFNKVILRISCRMCKFRDLVSLLASRGLISRAKGRSYSPFVRSVALYGSETWPVKEDVIRRGMREMMYEWLDDCAMLGLGIGFLQKKLELKYKTFKVGGNFLKGQPRKKWNEGMRSDMQEKIGRKDIAKDRNDVQVMQHGKKQTLKRIW